MTPSSAPGVPVRNALIAVPAQQAAIRQPQSPAVQLFPSAVLASAIGHAALLSDTPEKWASTVAMLRQNGIDPDGYEDFENGRTAAMAAAGTPLPREETEQPR